MNALPPRDLSTLVRVLNRIECPCARKSVIMSKRERRQITDAEAQRLMELLRGASRVMAALPYMPLFVADYLADTAHLTPTQHGVYLLLIMNYWQRGGPLPDDDRRLASIARVGPREWARHRDVISEFFSIADGQWSHSRVQAELQRVEAKSLKSKKAAQASVQRRFGERSTGVEPTDTDKNREKKKSNNPPKGGYAFEGKVIRLTRDDFDQWRKAYPGLDLAARLQSRDDWLAYEATDKDRERWFMSTSNWLANKQQEIAIEERARPKVPL